MLIESFTLEKQICLIWVPEWRNAISLALSDSKVTAVDPDPSETIGCGAIRKLAKEYNLSNINVVQSYGESLPFNSNSFDIVHVKANDAPCCWFEQIHAGNIKSIKTRGIYLQSGIMSFIMRKIKSGFLEAILSIDFMVERMLIKNLSIRTQ